MKKYLIKFVNSIFYSLLIVMSSALIGVGFGRGFVMGIKIAT